MEARQVAYFQPTKWWVEKLIGNRWHHAGDYSTREKAEARARDLAQFYRLDARVMEGPLK